MPITIMITSVPSAYQIKQKWLVEEAQRHGARRPSARPGGDVRQASGALRIIEAMWARHGADRECQACGILRRHSKLPTIWRPQARMQRHLSKIIKGEKPIVTSTSTPLLYISKSASENGAASRWYGRGGDRRGRGGKWRAARL